MTTSDPEYDELRRREAWLRREIGMRREMARREWDAVTSGDPKEIAGLEGERCPQCREDPGNCDWCSRCGIPLLCTATAEGRAAATVGPDRDGNLALILARAEGEASQS